MKILTYNLERLKHNKQAILSQIESFDADIIVLTETSSALQLNDTYNVCPRPTPSLFYRFDTLDLLIQYLYNDSERTDVLIG